MDQTVAAAPKFAPSRSLTSMAEQQPAWQRFRLRKDSLRIAASQVAALAGYHPYKVLPELLLQLIYQGRDGQALLQQDATVLQIELTSEEAVLAQLAKTAGPSTQAALRQAQTKVPQNVQQATKMKQSVLEEAKKSGRLTTDQVQRLHEGVRSRVDTGFGTYHEEDALNWLQAKSQCEIRSRNQECLQWEFELCENKQTVRPVGPPTAAAWTAFKRTPDSDQRDADSKRPAKRAKSDSSGSGGDGDVVDLTADESDIENNLETQRPFFLIVGSVDGIRDEWKSRENPKSGENDFDDDEWYCESSIVEVKHRMRRFHAQIPLYEQIQAVTYSLMYNVKTADVVQVLRQEENKENDDQKLSPSSSSSSSSKQTASKAASSPTKTLRNHTLDGWLEKKSDNGRDSDEGPKDDGAGTSSKRKQEVKTPTKPDRPSPTALSQAKPQIQCSVHTVSLDDPSFQHRHNFHNLVLPRLKSFSDNVYRIREDDGRRYQLLLSVAEGSFSGHFDKAWEFLYGACPWLSDCKDVARARASSSKPLS